jgi:hypothetical protein
VPVVLDRFVRHDRAQSWAQELEGHGNHVLPESHDNIIAQQDESANSENNHARPTCRWGTHFVDCVTQAEITEELSEASSASAHADAAERVVRLEELRRLANEPNVPLSLRVDVDVWRKLWDDAEKLFEAPGIGRGIGGTRTAIGTLSLSRASIAFRKRKAQHSSDAELLEGRTVRAARFHVVPTRHGQTHQLRQNPDHIGY